MISLIWAMMILPLADSLQNCFQNLTSRIAGIDNEQMAGRVLGIGTMMGFSLGAIKEQFKTPNKNNINNESSNSNNGLKGFVSRAKAIISPTMNLSSETDYNGNINPIRNVEKKFNPKPTENTKTVTTTNNNNNNNKPPTLTPQNIATNTLKTGYSITKNYLKTGANLVEGNFNNNSYKSKKYEKNNFQSAEYINKLSNDKLISKKPGDENDP